MNASRPSLAAIVLAAGLSVRMGRPKMLLPWGDKSVIQAVVDTLIESGIEKILVVTGAVHEQIGRLLEGYPVELVFNPRFQDGEMLHSLQSALTHLDPEVEGFFIVLGDQPQLLRSTVISLMQEFDAHPARLIIPSFQMHRGHPWLIHRTLWEELVALQPPYTLRDILQKHAGEIHYVNLDTPSILADLDTPEDYQKYRPETG
ncbi:MAG TPA: nucleotidyltransferase family protein [Anaerolineaceae bacterium]|nr:nucleotidyltransferase family protein [Anaerolineaceae bacterium]